ncbi:MAG: FtsX-like permease family protein [Vicinamibacterales bacterium]
MRAARRAREMAIHASLGASPGRLVRLVLAEGLVLAVLGGTLGLGVSLVALRVFSSAIPADTMPYWLEYSLDRTVLVALVVLSLGTVLGFAVVPAAQTARSDARTILADGGRGSRADAMCGSGRPRSSRSRWRWRSSCSHRSR